MDPSGRPQPHSRHPAAGKGPSAGHCSGPHQSEEAIESLVEEWLSEEAAARLPVTDDLRLLSPRPRSALADRDEPEDSVRFQFAEIARGLLISPEAAKKRVQRAKKTLAQRQVRIDLPPAGELRARPGSRPRSALPDVSTRATAPRRATSRCARISAKRLPVFATCCASTRLSVRHPPAP